MRCWICGTEPEMVDVTRWSDRERRFKPGRWPPSDDGHIHAERSPTPAELEQAGHDTLMRIRDAAM